MSNNSVDGRDFVKGRAIFSLSQGEIARKIKESEFAQMDTLRGFIVEDGVCALLYINGEIAEVKGGNYSLVSPSEINLALHLSDNGDSQKSGFIARVKRFWTSIKNFVTRTENNTSQSPKNTLALDQRIDDIVRNLTHDTIVALYLRCERNFNIIIGCKQTSDGSVRFQPLHIRTKYLDIDMGVSLSLRITDTHDFISNYMHGRNSVTPYLIQEELTPYVSAILQEEMANSVVENHQLDPIVRDRIITRILALSRVLKGIEVVSVVDLTCDGDDLNRFRAVAREMYLSDKELDYIQRTNELKNRMADTVNSQHIHDVRNEYELRIALDNINKDSLLHEDEMQQFAEQLALAKNKRDVGIEIMQMEQLAELAMKKTKLEKMVLHHQLMADKDTDDLKYEIYKKEREHQLDELDFEQAIYGKKYLIEKQRLADAWQREDELMVRDYKNRMFEADNDTELIRKQLEQDSIVSSYNINKLQQLSDFEFRETQRRDDYNFGNAKRQDDYSFEKMRREKELQWQDERRKRDWDMEELQKKQQMSMQNMQAMLAMDLQLTDSDHRNKMEAENAQRAFDLEKERMRHEEQMNKDNLSFQLGMQQSDNLTRMGADQIAASQLSELTPEQALAYSEMFSSRKDAKAKEDMLRFANERNQQSHDDMMNMMNQNRQDMQNMMAMMMQGMQNMAGMNMQNIQNIAGMNMQTQQNLMNMQQSAMQQQIDDTKKMKDEYRQQAMHQQERTDQNQQQSLNYTTLVQTNGASAGQKNKEDNKEDKKEEKK